MEAGDPVPLLDRLIEPPPHVRDPVTRRQLRVLLAILVPLVPLGYAVFLLPTGGGAADPTQPGTLLGIGAVTGLLAAYAAGRAGRYVPAAAATLAILLGALWGFAWLEPVDASGILVYLTLPVFLTSLLLGPRATAAVSVAVVASVALEVFPHRALDTVELLTFLAIHATVIGVGTLVRSRDLERIADQARTLRETETTLRLAQQVARAGSWSWELGSDRVELSDEVHRIFGTVPDAPPPLETVLDRFPPEARERLDAFARSDPDPGETIEVETPIRREDSGEARDVVLRGRVQERREGRPPRVVGIVQDVTERRRLEEQARKRVREEARRQELEEVLELASHQLREPLRNATGHGQLLARHLGDDLPDAAADDLAAIRRAVLQMDATLTDLNTYLAYATARPDPATVDPGAALQEARSALAAELADPDVRLEVGTLPPVRAETGMLGRVLYELLHNAITHHDDPPARIEVTGRRDGDRVLLAIRDDGPGIDPRHRDRVLELFQRLDRDDPERTGLGLALARRIVETLDGTIRIGDAPGGGTLVEIELPAADGEEE